MCEGFREILPVHKSQCEPRVRYLFIVNTKTLIWFDMRGSRDNLTKT